MERLRSPDGCPWDREQTLESLRHYLIEEAYEVAEAIDLADRPALCEELGDLLLQIVFQSQLAREEGSFTIDDVVASINGKMIRRHPHVFGDADAETADDVLAHWERIKKEEKISRGAERPSALDGVPVALPALVKALKLGSRASRVGFDWERTGDVVAKVHEELAELEEAMETDDGSEPHSKTRVREELGDLLFAVVNLARKLDVDPEGALEGTNLEFRRRFQGVEAALHARGIAPEDASLDEMEALWNAQKRSSE